MKKGGSFFKFLNTFFEVEPTLQCKKLTRDFLHAFTLQNRVQR